MSQQPNKDQSPLEATLYQLRPRMPKSLAMRICFEAMPSRGVPHTLFHGVINGLKIEINDLHAQSVIDGALSLTNGSLIEWKVWLEHYNPSSNEEVGVEKATVLDYSPRHRLGHSLKTDARIRPIIGAHSDFGDED